jgi:Protein of unknown function (DUF2934)
MAAGLAANVDTRVRERAEKLWRESGRPPGGPEAYFDEAKEILAIEDNPKEGTVPLGEGYANPGPWGEPIENSRVALDNEGEFPTTTDQGEQQNPEPIEEKLAPGRQEEIGMTVHTEPDREERIRMRAYQLWLEEGQPHGRDEEHWDRARRIIEDEEARRGPQPGEGDPEGVPNDDPLAPRPITALADPLTPAVSPPPKKKSPPRKRSR